LNRVVDEGEVDRLDRGLLPFEFSRPQAKNTKSRLDRAPNSRTFRVRFPIDGGSSRRKKGPKEREKRPGNASAVANRGYTTAQNPSSDSPHFLDVPYNSTRTVSPRPSRSTASLALFLETHCHGRIAALSEPNLIEKSLMERSDPKYAAAARFLLERINYEKTVDRPYDQQTFRLGRMVFLLHCLENPHLNAPVIHIAGTKGKGSVAWLLAEGLRRSGLNTGLYTSPHLEFLEERFVINGQSTSPDSWVNLLPRLRQAAESCEESEHGSPTFFELTTALAWMLFQEASTDVNVIEVGLGGRLDSTNICSPALSMITSISFDHQQQLGNTLAKIAAEKAGIIKDGVPVIHGVRVPEARDVIRHVSESHGSELWELGVDFDAKITPTPPPLKSPLEFLRLSDRVPSSSTSHHLLGMLGRHQGDNAALVIAAWQRLNADGWDLPYQALQESLSETQVPARVEIISVSPTTIVDSAHNEASIDALLDTLHTYFDAKRRTIIFACSKDKKYREMLLKILPKCDQLILTQYHSNPRFVPVERLEALASELKSNELRSKPGSETELFSAPGIDEAIRFATQRTSGNELICVTGSFFIASEARLRLLHP